MADASAYSSDGHDALELHAMLPHEKFYRVFLCQGLWHVTTKFGMYEIDKPEDFMSTNKCIILHDTEEDSDSSENETAVKRE